MDLIDFSSLEKLSGGDSTYFTEVIKIFIDSSSKSIEKLKMLSQSDDNHMEISNIAHSIKSGVGIIKIKGLLDELIQVEKLAKNREMMNDTRKHLNEVFILFENALPILERHTKKTT